MKFPPEIEILCAAGGWSPTFRLLLPKCAG
jgi:hypothetical protein